MIVSGLRLDDPGPVAFACLDECVRIVGDANLQRMKAEGRDRGWREAEQVVVMDSVGNAVQFVLQASLRREVHVLSARQQCHLGSSVAAETVDDNHEAWIQLEPGRVDQVNRFRRRGRASFLRRGFG